MLRKMSSSLAINCCVITVMGKILKVYFIRKQHFVLSILNFLCTDFVSSSIVLYCPHEKSYILLKIVID